MQGESSPEEEEGKGGQTIFVWGNFSDGVRSDRWTIPETFLRMNEVLSYGRRGIGQGDMKAGSLFNFFLYLNRASVKVNEVLDNT